MKKTILLLFAVCITNTVLAQTKLSYNGETFEKLKENYSPKDFKGGLSETDKKTIYNNLALFASMDTKSQNIALKSTIKQVSHNAKLNTKETKILERIVLDKDYNFGVPVDMKFSSEKAKNIITEFAKTKKESSPTAYNWASKLITKVKDFWNKHGEEIMEVGEKVYNLLKKIFSKKGKSGSSFMLNENGEGDLRTGGTFPLIPFK